MNRWKDIPVAVVADMIPDSLLDPAIRPLRNPGTQPKMVGSALTVNCARGDIGALIAALDLVQPGHVLVIATEGCNDAGMIGGILSGHARARGAVGVVCDGAVRDTKELASWNDFSVFSRSVCARGPVLGNDGAVNVVVKVGGRSISPGDILIGDDDGLVVLRHDQLDTAIDAVRSKLEREEVWIKSLANGTTAKRTFCPNKTD